jgi:hypothetical protein
LPNDSSNYSYVVYPLQAGFCKLPKLQIKLNNYDFKAIKQNKQIVQPNKSDSKLAGSEMMSLEYESEFENLDLIIQTMIPSQIFIMPKKVNITSAN